MRLEIKTPVFPESVSEGTIETWHKNAGDQVNRDEILVDLETDKVRLEVPAPDSGVLSEIVKSEGETVYSDEVLAFLQVGQAEAVTEPAKPETPSQPAGEPASSATDGYASPAARRLAHQLGIEPGQIVGTGKAGRITKGDVLEHEANASTDAAAPVAPAAPAASPIESDAQPQAVSPGAREERREPMSRLRRTVAARLVESQHSAALLTTFNEVDLTEVMAMRTRHRDAFEAKHGVRLGFMSFFVKASVEALKANQGVNARIDGDDIVYHDYCDIGIAVSSPRGLVVPVLRDAHAKGFGDIEREIREFGEKAKTGSIAIEELTGGTFTITNGGVFGSLVSTPIVNPPQSGILGMHKIQQRPVAVDGEVVVRPMMYLALTYDHRIIDGREAVTFLVSIKESLEDPSRLLLEL